MRTDQGMAKKKTNKGGKKKASTPELPPERKEAADYVATLDEALDKGAYAGVRLMADRAPATLNDEERQAVAERVGRVTVDRAQLGVGGFAILCVLIAAAITLVTG